MTLLALGRTGDAMAAAEQGLELADLSGNDRMLLWAHATASRAQLAAGAVTAALEHAERAAAAGAQPDLQAAGEPGWCIGNALTAAGNPGRAVDAMLASFGGPALAALPAAARLEAAADLAEAQPAAGDAEGAERTLADREPVTAPLLLARSAVLLARDMPTRRSTSRWPRRPRPPRRRSPPRGPSSPWAAHMPRPGAATRRWPRSPPPRRCSTRAARSVCATRPCASCGGSGTGCAGSAALAPTAR